MVRGAPCHGIQSPKTPVYQFESLSCDVMIALFCFDERLQVVAKLLVELTQSMSKKVHQCNTGQSCGVLFCILSIYFDVIEIG